MGSLNVNDKAPAFNLPSPDKSMVSLDDYAGRKLVIAFFPAVFTGVCTNEMCTFSAVAVQGLVGHAAPAAPTAAPEVSKQPLQTVHRAWGC